MYTNFPWYLFCYYGSIMPKSTIKQKLNSKKKKGGGGFFQEEKKLIPQNVFYSNKYQHSNWHKHILCSFISSREKQRRFTEKIMKTHRESQHQTIFLRNIDIFTCYVVSKHAPRHLLWATIVCDNEYGRCVVLIICLGLRVESPAS